MNAPRNQRQRTVLTEDGELHDLPDMGGDSAANARLAAPSAVFCTSCGVANPAHSRFCRNCGQSLDEQVIDAADLPQYSPPAVKNKRLVTAAPQVQPQAAPGRVISVWLEIITVVVVAMSVIWTSYMTNSAVIPISILVAWFMVEAARHGVLNGK